MSLRASLKIPKYGLFYFKSDRTTSIVLLDKIVKVISGDKKSNSSKVELNYGGVTLEAEIIGVNGMYVFLTQTCISWLNTCFIRNDLEIHETRNISDRNRRFGASCAIIKVT